MTKLKRLVYDHRFFFVIFAALLAYEWVIVGKCRLWQTDVVAYEFHAVDFGMGFGSFILPGQVYQWICGPINARSLTVYHTVLILLFFIALSAFLERLYLSVEQADRRIAGVLIALFVAGPCTFSIFVTDLGMPEVYWVYLAALFFLCLAYKPLHLLIAPLCVLALMVNYAAMICYVPFFCILLLYKLSTESEKGTKRMLLVTFIVCVCVSVAAYAYLAPNTMKNMKLSLEEYNALMRSRGVEELTYTDSLFYGRYEQDYPADFYARMAASPFYTEGETITPLQRLINFAVFRLNMVRFHLSNRSPLMLLVPLAAIFPILALIFRFCVGELRNKANSNLRRFVFFCMPSLFSVSILVSWPLSFDFFKWMDFAFLPLFASFLYVFYREKQYVTAYIRRAVSLFTYPQILVYASVYSICVLSAYY